MTETNKTNTSNQKSPTDASSSSAVTNGLSGSSHNKELVTLKTSLRSIWFNRRSKNLNQFNTELVAVFSKYTEPLKEYLELLDLIIDNGWNGSFSHYITKHFMGWLAKPETQKPEGGFQVTQDIQITALTIGSKAFAKDIKALIYQLYKFEENRDLIFTIAPKLKEKNHYLQLSQWISLFHMGDKFELTEFLYPLLLTKNCYEVFSYVEAYPDTAESVVKFSDSIFYTPEDLLQKFTDFNLLPPKKQIVSQISKNIESLMKKCIKKFNISSELTPNFNKKMIETEIRFYVLSLSKNEMTEEGFKERVEPLCKDSVDRQTFLVQNLLKRKQTEYLAEYYCGLYNVEAEYPKGILRVEFEEDYHSVDNLLDLVVFVDSQKSASSMLQYIDSLCDDVPEENTSQSGIPVGIDTEWKSICGYNIVRPPALLQVAFEKKSVSR